MSGPEQTNIPPETEAHSNESVEIDREKLNIITQKAFEPGVYFGKGLELTMQDRAQFELVLSKGEVMLETLYEDPDWKIFLNLVDEGSKKGVLMSFTNHKDTNVPTWCVDGGEKAEVRKIRRTDGTGQSAPAIEVPTRIFNLYHWHNTLETLRGYATRSDEFLRGTSPKPLGQALYNLVHLIGKTETEAKSEDM